MQAKTSIHCLLLFTHLIHPLLETTSISSRVLQKPWQTTKPSRIHSEASTPSIRRFQRCSPAPTAHHPLTWSYTAFLTATARRKGQVPASWGGNTGYALPTTCKANSAKGTYAVKGSYAPPCATATSVAVTFREVLTTAHCETVYMGRSPSLGSGTLTWQLHCPQRIVRLRTQHRMR